MHFNCKHHIRTHIQLGFITFVFNTNSMSLDSLIGYVEFAKRVRTCVLVCVSLLLSFIVQYFFNSGDIHQHAGLLYCNQDLVCLRINKQIAIYLLFFSYVQWVYCSCSVNAREYKKTYLLQTLDDFFHWITSWTFTGARREIPVQRGWLLAISSMKAIICRCLFVMDFGFLLTGRFNQDFVEVIINLTHCRFAVYMRTLYTVR